LPIRSLEYARARFARTTERLRELVWPEAVAPDELTVAGPVDRIAYDQAQALEYRPVDLGERFGPLWSTYWFRLRASVPESWRGRRVDLLWVTGSESTLWRDGRPVQGLNTGGGGERPDALLLEAAAGGEQVAVEIELACNGMFGSPRRRPELERCELAPFDHEAWELLHDFETLRALETDDGLDPSWAGELREELTRFCDAWRSDDRDTWAPARTILADLHAHRGATRVHELAAIGHAHIDTAWLWPLEETFRKTVRTFSSQTRYMDRYPEYRFACSQAQQYAWIKERCPDLWARIRAKVAAGQFVPVGGSWVEPDCNIPSGESLLRQFLHGQRFFERELGVRCREFWSPDAFGYTNQLPQLMRLAGLSRFLTQKLSWNRFNRPEHHTFVWQGIDGSEVLGHFPPADTYSSDATVPELLRTQRDYLDHDESARSLLVFGYGDGGGGPTPAMLETLRRARDLQGLPRTRITTSDEFFDALEAEGGDHTVVVGELYLEYHRGTYTTQGFVKRANRRCEQGLHDAEFLSCVRGDYPRAELDRLWKLLLLQQFHDILPGSSIRLVYEDAARDFAELERRIEAICGSGATPVNTTGFARREVVADTAGELRVVEAAPYAAGRVVEPGDEVRIDGLTIENAHLLVRLAADGSVESVVERASGRETLAAAGNRLELYDDLPVEFDAWDIDPSHLESRRDAPPADRWEVVTAAPLRAEIAFERRVGRASALRQVVRLDAGSRRLELHATVDWRESHTLLKVCFPLAVRALTATYETAFGYTERPTHRSTRFDAARYEVPGHRFADLSEHGFGAALLTDSKYGYSCHGNELRISLLRSPKSPDPDADMGRHEFAYAFLPHAGGWREGGVLADAVRFNAPVRWTDAPAVTKPFASVEAGELVLDTVKRAEDSDALVLRLYEPYGGRGTARVQGGLPFTSARLANALEEEDERLEVDRGAVVVPYRPHQVLTLVLR
jgi:alpha-mannosidase